MIQSEEGGYSFAIVTWSDADVMSALQPQLERLALPRPPYFDKWINLKLSYKSHFRREPSGDHPPEISPEISHDTNEPLLMILYST